MKLSHKLFLVYLLFTLAILLPIGIFIYFSAIGLVEKQIQSSLNEKAKHMLDKMDRVLFERYSDMQTIVSDPVFTKKNSNTSEITQKLISYRNQRKVYISLSFYDKNCIRKADTIGFSIGEKCSDSLWTKEVFSDNKISIASDIHYSEELGKKVIVFAAPILNEAGALQGAVAAYISIGRLHQIISNDLEEEENLFIDLVDHDSRSIYSNHTTSLEKADSKRKEENILREDKDTIFAIADEEGFLDFTGNRWSLFLQYPKEKAFEPIRLIRNQGLQIGFLIITISLFLIYYISKKSIKPLMVLKNAAFRLGQGDLQSRVSVSSKDEIGELSQSFNRMADDLSRSLEELEKQNLELEKLDKLKDEFLSNTSHELRTPLNGIIGIAESMMDGASGDLPIQVKSNLRMITSSGKRLASLVNDILDFSKLKNGELILQKKAVDLKSLAEMVLLLTSHLSTNKQITLSNEIPDDIPPVFGDENRLQQILLNLIGNAVKFTNQGHISISVLSQIKNQITVVISDTGIGIPEDKFESIFQSFEQVDASISREYGGTGLGLSITKQLIELQGGKIWLSSELGKGSQFYFTIPISNLPVEEGLMPPLARFQETPVSGDNIKNIHYASTKDRINILIVDDEPVNLQVLENYLNLAHYGVLKANNGEEALKILEQEEVNLILLDIMMPKLSGYDVCKTVRLTHTSGSLPIIMLTAKNLVNDLVYGFECGANDYIAKPFQKEELLTRIRTHIQISTLNKSYGRFVPHDYLQFLSKESIIDVNLGDNVATEMSVIFSDIRSFATLSEGMTPQENFNFINAYFKRISPKVREYGGIIVKYVGDAIMSVYKNETERAIDSVISQLKELEIYNQSRIQKGYLPIKTGYGIHTGFMMLGMIGESHRMQGDAFSDHVNLASRLEGLTKHYGVNVILSADIVAKFKDSSRYSIRYLDRVRVKGRKQAIEIYELMDADEQILRDKKMNLRDDFKKAINFYMAGDMNSAIRIFQSLNEQIPEDKVFQVYLERSKEFSVFGIPEDWDGVYDMKSK
ncbi:hypothetical protein LPTSP3_g34930 [Leptospira kobayashii]|uniref:histidine kinase n=1 Tax=Leptospira kobayashii TaxID=1917830 RepID=A0ABN6KH41_9LEPT|nr:ATP-binding protein [Leptospira kobayashii]BDA80563.1 hypothetical protein LPTSP3_g34930 [Leptospira kobayashii]